MINILFICNSRVLSWLELSVLLIYNNDVGLSPRDIWMSLMIGQDGSYLIILIINYIWVSSNNPFKLINLLNESSSVGFESSRPSFRSVSFQGAIGASITR